jgi:hypothetical protein
VADTLDEVEEAFRRPRRPSNENFVHVRCDCKLSGGFRPNATAIKQRYRCAGGVPGVDQCGPQARKIVATAEGSADVPPLPIDYIGS